MLFCFHFFFQFYARTSFEYFEEVNFSAKIKLRCRNKEIQGSSHMKSRTKFGVEFIVRLWFFLSFVTPHCNSPFVVILSDIDDCANQPCQNGANCTDAVNDFTCNCAAGYSGKNCSNGEDKFHCLIILYD